MARKEPQTIDAPSSRTSKPRSTAVVAAPKSRRTEVGAPTDWRSEMAKYAAKTIKMEESTQTSNRISTKGGRLMYHDTQLRDNRMHVIILAALIENVWYEHPFDPDNPASPDCFAFSEDGEDMAPHEKAHDPQHDTCQGCPKDEWGTADRGRGKACKNRRRLAVLSCEEVTPKSIEEGEIAMLEVSVTAVKGYSAYAKQLSLSGLAPWAWQTTVSLVQSPGDTFFHLEFQSTERKPISEKLYSLILKRVKEAEKIIDAPYVWMDPSERALARGKGKGKVPAKPRGKKF